MIRPGVREYFRLRPHEARVKSEVDEEIAFHIEERVRVLTARGHSEETARAEAERRFGALARARLTLQRSAQHREYRMSFREWLADWRRDFSYTARSLAREPLVSLVVVVTLALGIGANATMFGIVDRLLLSGPGHVTNPEAVTRLYFTQKNWMGDKTTSHTGYVTYTTLRDHTRSFDAVAVYGESTARIGTGSESREIPIARTSWDLFPMLGVKPLIGRFFDATEDHTPVGENVAVISYDMWKTEFGGANDVLGKTITLSQVEYRITGVAPRGFTGPKLSPVSAWVPFTAGQDNSGEWATSWCCTGPGVMARLKPGVTPEAASADATRAYRAAALEDKESNGKKAAEGKVDARPLAYGDNGEEMRESAVTRWLAGVSLIVLIVACANVVNLLLARAVRRRREVSVRLAMGISRARLLRLLLTESLLLAIAAGIASIALVYWGGKFIRATLLPDVQWGSAVDGRVLLFSAVVALAVGLIVGIVPALQSTRQDLTSTLKATSRGSGGHGRSTLREGLTILQAALSLVLLVGAGLFVRSLNRIDHMDLGIDANRILAVWSTLPPLENEEKLDESAAWKAREARDEQVNRAALERLLSRSDVESAALALGTPLQNSFGVGLKVPGFDSIPHLSGGGPYIMAVSPTYFATAGTQVLKGRTFGAGDGKGSPLVTVVSQTMARTLWPEADPLAKCLVINDAACASVIGVVEDVHRTELREKPSMQYYVPLGQETGIAGTQLIVRPRGDAASFIPTLRKELFAVAPNARYFDIDPLSKRLDPQVRPWKLGATLFMAFGALALLISGIGLFSVIAYGVSQRRTELGIRLALGAHASGLIGLVVRQGVALALAGILIGVFIVLAASRFMEPLLFDTSARDALTIAAVCAILLATTIAACLLPAVRAGRINPVDALRAE